jgi:hypothetical protein
MSLLIAAQFLKSWNQIGNSHLYFLINWSLMSSAMCYILRLMVLLDKGIFSAIVWASYILQFYVLPCKMLAKHCLALMPAYRNYHFVDLTLLTSC